MRELDNFKILLAYDGSDFLGWQDAGNPRSIEATLRSGLEKVLGTSVKLQAASRTDRGVHASGQVVNFLATTDLSEQRLRSAFNANLPAAIRLLSVERMAADFHPTLDAKAKIYRYYLYPHPVMHPHFRRTCWHYRAPIERARLLELRPRLCGEQSFKALANRSDREDEMRRRVERIDFQELSDGRLLIEVEGAAFLYKMVRNIVGTLVYYASGRLALKQIEAGLLHEDRRLLGPTAPSNGLFLHKVLY